MASRVNVPALLTLLGIKAERHGHHWRATCPNPDHPDRNPSWSIRDDVGHAKHGSHACLSCGFAGGPWELAAGVWGCTVEEAGRRLWRALRGKESPLPAGVPRVVVKMPHARKQLEMPPGVEFPGARGKWLSAPRRYLESRGVTDDQIDRWNIGYAVQGPLAWRVVVPVVTGGRLVSYVARAFVEDASRYHTPEVADGAEPAVALLGEHLFDRDQPVVTVSEGWFKAMALERAGAPNACAVLGVNNLSIAKVAMLARFRAVMIAPDPDKAGERMARELAVLDRRQIVYRLPLAQAADDADPHYLAEQVGVGLTAIRARLGPGRNDV